MKRQFSDFTAAEDFQNEMVFGSDMTDIEAEMVEVWSTEEAMDASFTSDDKRYWGRLYVVWGTEAEVDAEIAGLGEFIDCKGRTGRDGLEDEDMVLDIPVVPQVDIPTIVITMSDGEVTEVQSVQAVKVVVIEYVTDVDDSIMDEDGDIIMDGVHLVPQGDGHEYCAWVTTIKSVPAPATADVVWALKHAKEA